MGLVRSSYTISTSNRRKKERGGDKVKSLKIPRLRNFKIFCNTGNHPILLGGVIIDGM